MLAQLGEIYLEEGVEPGKIAYKMAEETGMSYRWTMKYMPARYKARPGAGGPSRPISFYESNRNYGAGIYKSTIGMQKSKVARFATQEYEQLLSEPKERILKVKNYNNTDFVNVVIERRFYAKLGEVAEKLGIEPEAIISNIFFLALRKLEQIVAKKGIVEASKEYR
jgi:hypothetical protein